MFSNGYRRKGKPDYFLMGIVFILTVFGLVILTSASSDLAKREFDNSYYYLNRQLINGLIPGMVGLILAYFFPYRHLRKAAPFFLAFNIILLLLLFTSMGVTANGATRWLKIGPLTFQPAEFLKLTFMIYVAALFSNPRLNRSENWKGLLPFLIACAVVGGLLILQPATSTVAILLLSALMVHVLSGAKLKHTTAIILLGLMVLTALVAATPYRRTRVMSFFIQNDDQGTNYHLKQSLIAIGSGRLTGTGFGQSQAKTNFLPAAKDDSIFAVAAQELGFIGAGTLIVLFGMLTIRLFWLSMKTPDHFGRLMLAGFGCIIGLQSLVNIGAISGIFPLTGVPLPFISYGGTALAVFLTMSGLSLNISKK